MLLVGYADEYLVAKAKEYSSDPILVTEKNWKDFVSDGTVGYTGIEEFSDKNEFLKLLLTADNISFYPPVQQWNNKTRLFVEYLLLLVNQHNPVSNLKDNLFEIEKINSKIKSILSLSDVRKTPKPQIWFAGCSITVGIGVKSADRFGDLVAVKLNKDASYLAETGASISWAADQILRSNISKDDIVVWGLTEKSRLEYFNSDQVRHVNIQSYSLDPKLEKIVPKKILLDTDHIRYHQLTSIHQVVNFCNKVEAKLLIFGILTHDDLAYLHELPNFYQYFNTSPDIPFVDLGTDHLHPGPKQHKLYADAIIEQLSKRNWI